MSPQPCLVFVPIRPIKKLFQPSISNQLLQVIPQSSTVLDGVSSFLVVLVMKTLVALHGISSHLVWPFEIWLILDLFQDLMHWLSEHRVNHLRSRRPRLPSKIPSGPATIVSIRPEISLILMDNLSISLPLLLIFLNPFVFFNATHKPTHTPYRLLSQGFSQIMFSRQADLKSLYSHVVKVLIDLIKHLPVSVQVRF